MKVEVMFLPRLSITLPAIKYLFKQVHKAERKQKKDSRE
jgi:hypothetical protein